MCVCVCLKERERVCVCYAETCSTCPVSRTYIGIQPNLVVNDLDMLREILVKRFNYFADRVSDRATSVSVMSIG